MKQKFILSLVLGVLPLSMMAQDDLYFTPKKSSKQAKSTVQPIDDDRPAYYSGSSRSDDEYNRRGAFRSRYEVVGSDSLGNDIIEFRTAADDSLYMQEPSSASKFSFDDDDDFVYSRHMSRFDDSFYAYDPWMYTHFGFGPYWRSRLYWGYYDPFYDPWYYGPYYGYYGWYGSWYNPWRWGYYDWGWPYYAWYGGWYGGGGGHVSPGWRDNGRNHGITGTAGHGTVGRPGRSGHSSGNFGGYRGNGQSTRAYNNRENRNAGGRFGGNRTYSSSQPNSSSDSRYTGNSRSTYSSSSTGGSGVRTSSSSGSFGGSRSGSFGGGGGATRSSGGTTHSSGGGGSRGGSFGGRR